MQPPDNFKPASAKMTIHNLGLLGITAVATLSCFWSMLMRKPGTVGTRAYALEMVLSSLLLIALSHSPYPQERDVFYVFLGVMYVGYISHLGKTNKSEKHVHSYCVGSYRYSKKGAIELCIGVAVGTALYYLGFQYAGGFVGVSALACTVRDALIEERDKIRSRQIADAIIDQEYMMHNYERFKR